MHDIAAVERQGDCRHLCVRLVAIRAVAFRPSNSVCWQPAEVSCHRVVWCSSWCRFDTTVQREGGLGCCSCGQSGPLSAGRGEMGEVNVGVCRTRRVQQSAAFIVQRTSQTEREEFPETGTGPSPWVMTTIEPGCCLAIESSMQHLHGLGDTIELLLDRRCRQFLCPPCAWFSTFMSGRCIMMLLHFRTCTASPVDSL